MILVLVEVDATGVVEVSREAITFARSLAEAGGGVAVDAVVVGEVTDPAARAARGVRRPRRAPGSWGEAFTAYGGAAWAAGRAGVPGGRRGRSWSPRPAPRAATRCSPTSPPARAWRWRPTCCRSAGSSPFMVTRQVVGGPALEEMELAERPAVFTVAGHAVEPQPAPRPGAADVVDVAPEVAEADLVARVVSSEEPEPDLSGGLKSARVVVGAGRGAGQRGRLRRPARARRPARRLAGRVPGGDQPGLAAAPRAGRPDRQPDLARSSTSRAGSAARSSTGPAARAPRTSWPSTPTPTRRWSRRRRTP